MAGIAGGNTIGAEIQQFQHAPTTISGLPALPMFPTQAPASPTMPVQSTNTTDISPYLKTALGRLNERYSADTSKRAIDKATTGTMDAAALAAADLKGNLSRRGLVGSEGGASFLQKRVFAPAQRQAAGQAADISMGEERRKDALTLGSEGLVTAPDRIATANRAEAAAEQQAQAQQQMMANQAQQQQVSQWLALIGQAGNLGQAGSMDARPAPLRYLNSGPGIRGVY